MTLVWAIFGGFEVLGRLAPFRSAGHIVGRMRNGERALDSLRRLSAGDPVCLKRSGDSWLIVDRHDVAIGRLARKYKPPERATFVEGSVYAISTRFRRDSGEEFQAQLRQDEWSVVLPELVYRS